MTALKETQGWEPRINKLYTPDGQLVWQKIQRTPGGEWEDYLPAQPEPGGPTPSEQYAFERGYQRALQVVRENWQTLTDEEIGDIIEASEITLKNYCSEDKQTEYARAIEAKIKERNAP